MLIPSLSLRAFVKLCCQIHCRTLVERTNSISGRKYKDDATIFAWDLVNEPRCETWRVRSLDPLDCLCACRRACPPDGLGCLVKQASVPNRDGIPPQTDPVTPAGRRRSARACCQRGHGHGGTSQQDDDQARRSKPDPGFHRCRSAWTADRRGLGRWRGYTQERSFINTPEHRQK